MNVKSRVAPLHFNKERHLVENKERHLVENKERHLFENKERHLIEATSQSSRW